MKSRFTDDYIPFKAGKYIISWMAMYLVLYHLEIRSPIDLIQMLFNDMLHTVTKRVHHRVKSLRSGTPLGRST